MSRTLPCAPVPGESFEDRKRRAGRIARRLARTYPNASCALHYETPFQLLVATILSAQCTDAMVNRVTPALFERWGTPEKLAAADPAEVEAVVRPTGFYRQKAKSIQSSAQDIVTRFGGEVPRTLEELTTLRGVARKTANVVLGNCFGVPGPHGGHAHDAREPAPPPHARDGPREDRARPDGAPPAARVDALLAPRDPARPRGVRRAQAALRRLRAARGMPLPRIRASEARSEPEANESRQLARARKPRRSRQ